MTALSLAARNHLALDPVLRGLLGKSQTWDTWIFDENPVGVKVENTGRCLIVINEGSPWTSPNEHNTMRFPRLIVDVWADPTRNTDRSVRVFDAKEKIDEIQKRLDKHFHLVDGGDSHGMPHVWGSLDDLTSGRGVVVTGSTRLTGPEFSSIRDTDGAFMGQFTYGVNLP